MTNMFSLYKKKNIYCGPFPRRCDNHKDCNDLTDCPYCFQGTPTTCQYSCTGSTCITDEDCKQCSGNNQFGCMHEGGTSSKTCQKV